MKNSITRRIAMNPLFITGMSLPVIIGGATTLRNALVLSATSIYLTFWVSVVLKAFAQRMPSGRRRVLSAIVAAVFYIPFALVLILRLGYMYETVGIFFPILCVSAVITYSPSEKHKFVSLSRELKFNLWITFSFCFVMCLIGAVRELLSTGALLGYKLLDNILVPDAAYPYVGFLIFGLLCAFAQTIRNYVRREEDDE